MSCSLTVGNFSDYHSRSMVEAFVLSGFNSNESNIGKGTILSRIFGRDPMKKHIRELIVNWFQSTDNIAVIDPLNIASMEVFMQHAAKLEGLIDTSGAGEGSKWPNLPYWMYSIWLPIEPAAKPIVQQVGGMPTLIGTAKGLIANLLEVQKSSNLKLGVFPKNFDLMLNDIKKFHSIADLGLNEADTIRWVWLSLMKGAELSLENHKPLFLDS
jgi:hypothetical protein